MPKPNDAMKAEAKRGLAWREEFKRGGTAVGVARARDIANGADLSPSTVARMVSYFARHEVDKKGRVGVPAKKDTLQRVESRGHCGAATPAKLGQKRNTPK